MKMTKKIMSLAIVFAMVMALAVSASAATIKVTTAVDGETYSAYKIFDATKNASGGIAYTISTDSAWWTIVKAYADDDENVVTVNDEQVPELVLTKSASNEKIYVVNGTNLVAKDFAAYLMEKKGSIAAEKTATAANGEATIADLAVGYYLVDSSLGALCVLNTTDTTEKIVEKNDYPVLAKMVMEDVAGYETTDAEWADEASAQYGQSVKFKLIVTIGKAGLDKDYVITDTIPTGMTYGDDAAIIGFNTDAATAALKVEKTGQVVTMTIDDEFLNTVKGSTIEIVYTAAVNYDAPVDTAMTNTAYLKYGTYKTETVDATVKVYQFDLTKTTENGAVLDGAKFKLFTADENGTEIKLVKDGNVYRPAKSNETAVEIVAGQATIVGLDKGTYYLEETEAPAGYNILTSRVAVNMTNGSLLNTEKTETSEAGEEVKVPVYALAVVNKTGTELPSTGGIGTTIFYALGGLMAVGAGVLLVAKKRMEA